MESRFSFSRVLAVFVVALVVASCSSGSDGSPNGAGSAGTMGSAATGGTSSGAGTSGSAGMAGGSGQSGGGAGSTGVGGAAATAGSGGAAGTGPGGAGAGAAAGTAGNGRGGASGVTGVAGGTGPGGRGGSAGTSATAGSSGTAGQGGAVAPMPSAGCTKPTTQALNQWVQSMVTSGGASRAYSVRLPNGYDPSRAYPVIVLLHGCGGGTNNVPMENVTGTNAILVRGTGSASGTCWDASANGADVAFVDAMIADVKARFCADDGRFFVVGYSSGSWLVNRLTCIRANVLRGAATVTGGESASGNCGGPVARIFIHDTTDTDNVISGSERARDRQLTQNGCDKSVAPVATTPSPCVRYPGCPAAYPVVWCATTGQGHNRQDSWAPAAFWNLFQSL